MIRSQVAELIGDPSEAGVRNVLRRLATEGTVIEQRIGKQYSYVAKGEHIAWLAVDAIVHTAGRLDAKIRKDANGGTIAAMSVELSRLVVDGTM